MISFLNAEKNAYIDWQWPPRNLPPYTQFFWGPYTLNLFLILLDNPFFLIFRHVTGVRMVGPTQYGCN